MARMKRATIAVIFNTFFQAVTNPFSGLVECKASRLAGTIAQLPLAAFNWGHGQPLGRELLVVELCLFERSAPHFSGALAIHLMR